MVESGMSRLRGPGVVTREDNGWWWAMFAGAEDMAVDELGEGESAEEAAGNLLAGKGPKYHPKRTDAA